MLPDIASVIVVYSRRKKEKRKEWEKKKLYFKILFQITIPHLGHKIAWSYTKKSFHKSNNIFYLLLKIRLFFQKNSQSNNFVLTDNAITYFHMKVSFARNLIQLTISYFFNSQYAIYIIGPGPSCNQFKTRNLNADIQRLCGILIWEIIFESINL